MLLRGVHHAEAPWPHGTGKVLISCTILLSSGVWHVSVSNAVHCLTLPFSKSSALLDHSAIGPAALRQEVTGRPLHEAA